MPLPLLAPALAVIGPWITRFFMAKAALMFAGFLGRVGLFVATNELIFEPVLEHITQAWFTIPPAWQCWFSLIGVVQVASILVTGMTLLSVKQVFFAKS